MSLKLNNVANRILRGNVPVSTVLMGDNVVYGDSFKIVDFSYPAVPKGVKGYTVYANDVPVLVSPKKAGTIKVGLYDYIKVKVEKADNYRNISSVKLVCGEEEFDGFEELDTYSYTPTGTSYVKKVVFSVMSQTVKVTGASVRLEIEGGTPCSVRYVTIPVKQGVASIGYELTPSPWSKRDAEAIPGEIISTGTFGVVEGAVIKVTSIEREEGYKIENARVIVNGHSYSFNQKIVVGDYTVNYEYLPVAGSRSVLRFPAAPEGVLYSIARTSSVYALHAGLTVLSKEDSSVADSYGEDPRKPALYEGDRIEITVERQHGYTYAEFALNGSSTQDGVGQFTLEADSNEITVEQLPLRGTPVTFRNPEEDFGYSRFDVESLYYNKYVADACVGTGDIELFVGDKIVSDGEKKIDGETMRVTKDNAYRTPSVGLKKPDGTVVLAPTRQYVSYVLDEDGIEVVYEAGAKKTTSKDLGTTKFQSKDTFTHTIPYELVNGALEKANMTYVTIGYYVKRYLGDGIITQFPYKTVNVQANESFSQDWTRTGGLLPPDSAKGVLEGSFTVGDTTCTLKITSYDVNYVSTISSKGCRYTPYYSI